jgi:epoxide hydrolase-like predicted phosphatase
LNSKPLIRAIIWDMGGVLVRTEDKTPRERLAQRYGMTLKEIYALVFDSEIAIQATVGELPESAVWEYVAKSLNLDPAGLAGFMREFWSGDNLDAELYQFVKKMRTSYKIGLLSNAWSGARTVLDNRYHMLDVFDGSIFSAEVGLAKPAPQIYRLILEKLGVRAQEAIFVDDFQANVDAANALGIHAVHFENSLQARQAVLQILDGGN